MGTMVDSSVLIPFFDGDHIHHQIAKEMIEKIIGEKGVINPEILLEVSHYFVHRVKTKRYFEIIWAILKNFNIVESDLDDYLDAVLYILPRFKNKIGARDAIILKNCIDNGLSLLTLDKNLKEAAEETGIDVI